MTNLATQIRAAVEGDKHTHYTELLLQAADLLDHKDTQINTRPAAPVECHPRDTNSVEYHETRNVADKTVEVLETVVLSNHGELVTRSQAEAIIAARDAEIEHLQKINALVMGDDENAPRYTTKRLKQEVERVTQVMRGEAADREAHVKTLQADNAALTAQVKELSEDRDSWRRVSERLARDSSRQSAEIEALETQLAAARKALELIDKAVSEGRFIRIRKIARAALEAKP